MLASYQSLTQALVQAPTSPIPLIPSATLTSYINVARNQVAGDAECIRVPATLALVAATQHYGFAAISVGGASGVGNVISVRSARIGGTPLDIRQWEWFAQYYLGDGATGTPVRLAQQGQGLNGTLFFDPVPTGTGTVSLDVVCLPIALVDDSTAEAIPLLWTDAVPFYAAWLALQSLQRQADANMMLERYRMLVKRGREMATPSELPDNLPGGAGAALAAARQTLAETPPVAQGR